DGADECGTEPAGLGDGELDIGPADCLELGPGAGELAAGRYAGHALGHEQSELPHALGTDGGQQILVIGEVSISSVVRHVCFARPRVTSSGSSTAITSRSRRWY